MSEATIVTQPDQKQETCPRCHSTESWGQSSWCPACGYYPAVDGNGASGSSWADALPEAPQEEQAIDCSPWEAVPQWFWVMLSGVIGIVVTSICLRVALPDQYPRAYFALAQLSVGMVSVFGSHIIAARLALSTDRRLNVTDILLSWVAIWQPTIQRLPQSCKKLWALIWGFVASVTAVTIIGGIDYSAPFRTGDAPKVSAVDGLGMVAAAAKAATSSQENLDDVLGELSTVNDQSLEGGLNDIGKLPSELPEGQLGGPQTLQQMLEQQAKAGKLPKRNIECFVYGVKVDTNNVPESFLLAANMTGQDQHIAAISAKDLPKDVFRKFAVRLYPEVRQKPVIDTSQTAVWVNPKIWCRVSFTKLNDRAELIDMEFKAILQRESATSDR